MWLINIIKYLKRSWASEPFARPKNWLLNLVEKENVKENLAKSWNLAFLNQTWQASAWHKKTWIVKLDFYFVGVCSFNVCSFFSFLFPFSSFILFRWWNTAQSRNLSEFLYLSLGRSPHKMSPSSRERKPQNWRRKTMDDRDKSLTQSLTFFTKPRARRKV